MSLIERGRLIDLRFKTDNPSFNTRATHCRTPTLRPMYNVINNVTQTQQGLGSPKTTVCHWVFPEAELSHLHSGLAFSSSGHSVHLFFSYWLPTTVQPSATQDLPQDALVFAKVVREIASTDVKSGIVCRLEKATPPSARIFTGGRLVSLIQLILLISLGCIYLILWFLL